MNYLVAMLLLFMEEEPAFWLLCTIVEELLPAGFYDQVRARCLSTTSVFGSYSLTLR